VTERKKSEKERKERVRVFYYDKDKLEERAVKSERELPPKNRSGVMWINVDGVHDVKLIEKIGKRFGLHDLVLKDVVNTEQRPKVENFDSHLLVVLKMLSKKGDKSNRIEIEQVSFVLGEKFVISFQEKERDVFDPIRERIRNEKSPIRKMGADYLLYSLIDEMVDNYFVILEKLGEEMELLEEALISRRSKNAMNRIHRLKVELIH